MRYKVQIVKATLMGVLDTEDHFFKTADQAKDYTRRFNLQNLQYSLKEYFFANYMGVCQ